MKAPCQQCGLPAARSYLVDDCSVNHKRRVCSRCARFHRGRVKCREFGNWIREIRADAAGQALRSVARGRA